ncbi:hypothetical protein [Ancylobacter lacus]|uniref:hypothetical protein n=1 Tax=Ancylobacter lacus TaxID=2579970 RepID=UPI001BD19533|nr:hypothetical protein [Ancylobacter lacus]MBS7541419.1 hypothetical protein [Ancylobacter lacus]
MSLSLVLRRGAVAATCLAALLAAGAAQANRAAGDACAAGLSPDAKAIYSSVVGQLGSGDLRSLVTDTTKSLAMSGKIDRGNARSNAQAAGKCLETAAN